jgi:putative hydrolase of the HAD superfamily
MTGKRITTLFLDIGGVLLTNGWGRGSRKRAAEKFALDIGEMEERHHLTFDTYEVGKLDLDEYLNRVVFYVDRPFPRGEFKKFMFAESQPLPGMIELVRSMKTRYGLKVAAVNNEGKELSIHRIRTFALDSFIDCFISSCFVHFRKPDTDIYRIALDIVQASPEEVLYIDDRALFVDVARGLGINAIHHTSVQETRVRLGSFGL